MSSIKPFCSSEPFIYFSALQSPEDSTLKIKDRTENLNSFCRLIKLAVAGNIICHRSRLVFSFNKFICEKIEIYRALVVWIQKRKSWVQLCSHLGLRRANASLNKLNTLHFCSQFSFQQENTNFCELYSRTIIHTIHKILLFLQLKLKHVSVFYL